MTSNNKRKPIPNRIRHQVFQRDGYRCRECGASVKDGATLEIDHIKPVAKGGTNDINNLQTLCKKCNRGKYTDEWIGGEVHKYKGKKRCPKCNTLINRKAKKCPKCSKSFKKKKIKPTPNFFRAPGKKRRITKEDIKKRSEYFKNKNKLDEQNHQKLMEEKQGLRKCPNCGKELFRNAIRCKYCKIKLEKLPKITIIPKETKKINEMPSNITTDKLIENKPKKKQKNKKPSIKIRMNNIVEEFKKGNSFKQAIINSNEKYDTVVRWYNNGRRGQSPFIGFYNSVNFFFPNGFDD